MRGLTIFSSVHTVGPGPGRGSGGGESRRLQLPPHDLRECRLHVRLVVQLRLHLLEWHVREHASLDENLRPLHVLDRRHGRP